MSVELVAAIAAVIAALFATLGFLHGVYVRWPRLWLSWHGPIGPYSDDVVELPRLELGNSGGRSARHVRVVIELDGETVAVQQKSVWPDRVAPITGVRLRRPEQIEIGRDQSVDLYGKTVRACVRWRRARFLPMSRSRAEYRG